jgi:hypothetical protein
MRNNALFWAIVLIVGGVLLLLGNLGILQISWGVIWPVFLIALGGWIVWGALVGRRRTTAVEPATIPLEDAASARVHIQHGAGRLELRAGAAANLVATGSFGGGVDCRTAREGDRLNVKMSVPHQQWGYGPWNRGEFDWDVQLNGQLPLLLKVETGASESHLDLTDLLVTEFDLGTGASATKLTLPAHAGLTSAKIQSGVASVEITVPGGVAAHIRATGGLASIDIDETRFPRSGDTYRSPDFDAAENKVDLRIETGVGSVRVR